MVHYEQLVKKGLLILPADQLREYKSVIVNFSDFIKWASQNLKIEIPYQPKGQQLTELIENIFVIARYITEGERAFRVETGLARLLLDTSLPPITGNEFRLPYPALYLEFPGKLFEAPIVQQIVIGCYLLDMRPKYQVVSVNFVGEPIEYLPGLYEFYCNVNIEVKDNQPIRWSDIFEVCLRSVKIESNSLTTQAETSFKVVAAFISEMLVFVVNTILYATSASPEITNILTDSRRHKPFKRKPGKTSPTPLKTKKCLLGQSIQVSYGAPRATDLTPLAKSDRKILKRFRVRGHWRWQRYGAEGKQRKHIFIAPFWKGPQDLAELLARKYQIK